MKDVFRLIFAVLPAVVEIGEDIPAITHYINPEDANSDGLMECVDHVIAKKCGGRTHTSEDIIWHLANMQYVVPFTTIIEDPDGGYTGEFGIKIKDCEGEITETKLEIDRDGNMSPADWLLGGWLKHDIFNSYKEE